MSDAVARALAAEQDRLFLWVPVAFGGGIAAYFSLGTEPSGLNALSAACIASILAGIWRRSLASIVIGGLIFWTSAGLAAAKWSTERAAAPVISEHIRRAHVTGWVELVEPRAGGGRRITIRPVAISARGRAIAVPDRVRIRIPVAGPVLEPGTAMAIEADLLPPAGPALPGAYDFARAAWFQGIGVVGYSRQRPQLLDLAEPMPLALKLWLPVERLRSTINRRIALSVPGETGAIAAALITGERGGISDATNNAYRASGIFHILSISGLHMTIFAGALYFLVRLILSLVPWLALRQPIKKWAALAGMAGTFGYLLISGGSPPAVRSGIMIGIMFGAILLDRPALALRNVALSALVILVASPSSLIDVGFQMSYAAVASLVAAAEAWRDKQGRVEGDHATVRQGSAARIGFFLAGIIATTLVATAAVAPFAAYYFHQSTQYGFLANLVAIPICNMVVMPAALLTMIALPIGMESLPLSGMALGIDAMTEVARRVASLPGAMIPLPEISTAAFGCTVAGGIWLTLWKGPLRAAGLAAVFLGLMIASSRDAPDVLVSANGQLVAVRLQNGRYAALDMGHSRFELGRWLEHDGDDRRPEDVGPGKAFSCDESGCVATIKGQLIAIAKRASALRDDCRKAVLVIWRDTTPAHCGSSADVRLIDATTLKREGTHAIRLGRACLTPPCAMTRAPELSIRTVAQARGLRPWSQVKKDLTTIPSR